MMLEFLILNRISEDEFVDEWINLNFHDDTKRREMTLYGRVSTIHRMVEST